MHLAKTLANMKYMGSKSRIAEYIVPIIQKYIDENNITKYVEPFVGGSNIIDKIRCDYKYGYDANISLIDFWKAIQNGWNPFNEVDMSKDFYDEVKNNKEKYPGHIVALCGLCATYNAKWFGGYAGIVHTKIGADRNYYDEAVRNVLKQKENISDVVYECNTYENIKVENCLLYCDPPYENTTKYVGEFDHEKYWKWVRKMSKQNIVLCSEYNAPDDFECIWSKDITTTLDKNSRSKATEKLFTYKTK